MTRKSKVVPHKQRRLRQSTRIGDQILSTEESATAPVLIGEKTEQRIYRKQQRRNILKQFLELQRGVHPASARDIVDLLSDHFSHLELVKEALHLYRSTDYPLSTTVWSILESEDPETEALLLLEIEEAEENKENLFLDGLPRSVTLEVPVDAVEPTDNTVSIPFLINVVRELMSEHKKSPIPSIRIEAESGSPIRPGQNAIKVSLPSGVSRAIDLNVLIEGAKEVQTSQRTDAYGSEADPLTEPEGHGVAKPATDQVALNKGSIAGGISVAKLPPPFVTKRSVEDVFPPVDIRQAAPAPKGMSATDEAHKLKILNLPPLVEYDLRMATVDLNTLQHLFRAFHLKSLKKKSLEEFTDENVRSLSYGINLELRKLKRGVEGPWVGLRPIATILLSVSRLQFARLEVGTYENQVRFCLSLYAYHMGQYLIELHGRFDSARDYFQEAITLSAERGVDFPTSRLFRSFINASAYHLKKYHEPEEFLELLDDKEWTSSRTRPIVSRCFLEMGAQNLSFADRWLDDCSDDVKSWIISTGQAQLSLKGGSFFDSVRAYKQVNERLAVVLAEMSSCSSSQQVRHIGPEFASLVKELGTLLNDTNIEISGKLAGAAEHVDRLISSNSYELKRDHINIAANLINSIREYGADRRTALWAEHFVRIAERWRGILNEEMSTISLDIAPILRVGLAEKSMSFDNEGKPRGIFVVKNTGKGAAAAVNVRFTAGRPDALLGPPSIRDFRINPNDSVEGYFSCDRYPQNESIPINYELTYYDPDRNSHRTASTEPICVLPVKNDLGLVNLVNPFQTDKEVDDEAMFVGRDELLNEVAAHASDVAHGGLLMLHGQRRVGKSSLLLFLERRLDEMATNCGVLALRVSWLDYSMHPAFGVIAELIYAINAKCKQRFDRELVLPSRGEIRDSYTLAFNDVLRQLESAGVSRLVLLVDEFDVIVNRLGSDAGYDRNFFEFLRGLSKRGSVALVLTGGEMMPMLFDQLGEIFNHDRTWRIAYLSGSDGSVERLIRNSYIREVVTISEDAMSYIKDVSACNPFFIQMLFHEIVERCRVQHSAEVCKLDVQEVANVLVRNADTTKYVRHLYSPGDRPDPLDMAIIGITAEEEIRGPSPQYVSQKVIIDRVQDEKRDLAVSKINELVRREIMKRSAEHRDEFRIMLPLFRDWFNDNKPEYAKWSSLLKRRL